MKPHQVSKQVSGLEVRQYRATLRLTGSDGVPRLEGHIAVFGVLSADLGGFREKIAPGAFAETIDRDDIRCLWNHENDLVLGRTSAGTLDLFEDEIGLGFTNRPPDTSWWRDRALSIKRGDVTGCSFGFVTDSDEWSTLEDGTRIRTLKKVTLIEVSPGVTFPAYSQPSAALNSMHRWLGSAGSQSLEMQQHQLRMRKLRQQLRCATEPGVQARIRRLILHGLSL